MIHSIPGKSAIHPQAGGSASPVDVATTGANSDPVHMRFDVRFIAIGRRKYTAQPEQRKAAALLMLRHALRLYAHHTSPGDASIAAGEALTELVQEERRKAA